MGRKGCYTTSVRGPAVCLNDSVMGGV